MTSALLHFWVPSHADQFSESLRVISHAFVLKCPKPTVVQAETDQEMPLRYKYLDLCKNKSPLTLEKVSQEISHYQSLPYHCITALRVLVKEKQAT